jgi:hypothetical protein
LQLLPVLISADAQPRLTSDAAVKARLEGRLGLPLVRDGFVSLVDAPPRKAMNSGVKTTP